MNVASLCTREVVSIPVNASLREAAVLMCEEHVGALVVVTADDPPTVFGVVTDRDLALEALGRDKTAVDLQVRDLVQGRPLGVTSRTGLREAASAMEEGGVRRLLVTDDDGGVIGIVSADDLIQAMADELATLARSLRAGLAREATARKVFAGGSRSRPLFAGFRTAMQ